MFRQYGGLFSQAEKELSLKRFTISKQRFIECLLVQQMGEPVVVLIASKEELLFASQEESKQFTLSESVKSTDQFL